MLKRGHRCYTHTFEGNVLSTWSQYQCVKCGKFLPKKGKKYCEDCVKIAMSESFEKYSKTEKGRLALNRAATKHYHKLHPESKYTVSKFKP